jgi:hypothetical protein
MRHSLANSAQDNRPAMAKSHLARVVLVLLCWELVATARLTKVNAKIIFVVRHIFFWFYLTLLSIVVFTQS